MVSWLAYCKSLLELKLNGNDNRSLGCLVLEMLTNEHPWHGVRGNVIYLLGTGHAPPIPDNLSPMAKDFLKKCFTIDPEARPTVSELLNEPFAMVDPAGFDFKGWVERKEAEDVGWGVVGDEDGSEPETESTETETETTTTGDDSSVSVSLAGIGKVMQEMRDDESGRVTWDTHTGVSEGVESSAGTPDTTERNEDALGFGNGADGERHVRTTWDTVVHNPDGDADSLRVHVADSVRDPDEEDYSDVERVNRGGARPVGTPQYHPKHSNAPFRPSPPTRVQSRSVSPTSPSRYSTMPRSASLAPSAQPNPAQTRASHAPILATSFLSLGRSAGSKSPISPRSKAEDDERFRAILHKFDKLM